MIRHIGSLQDPALLHLNGDGSIVSTTKTNAMISSLRSRLRDGRLHRWLHLASERSSVSDWRSRGCPLPPPPAYKQSVIRAYAAKHELQTLIETGTCAGATIAACLHSFETIHSIELSEELHSAAVRRFERRPKVKLWRGDSASQLPRVLMGLAEPALFWLDAHYSGAGTAQAAIDTPVAEELKAIANHPIRGHVLLIDDARHFTGINGYPTVKECKDISSVLFPSHQFEVEHDIIRITPRPNSA